MLKLLFIVFILNLSIVYTEFIQETHFLVDFMVHQNCTPKIVAVNCFTRDKLISMSKIFSKNYMAITYLNHTNFIENFELYKGRLTFLLDTRCQHHKNILDQVSDINYNFGHQYFNESFDWIILEENTLIGSIFDRNFYCGINSKVFFIHIKEQEYKIDAIFKTSRNDTKFSKNNIGLWTAESGFKYFNRLNISSDRNNLKGLSLRVLYPFKYSLGELWKYNFRQFGYKDLLLNTILFRIIFSYFNATYLPVFFDKPYGNSLITLNDTLFLQLKFGLGDITGVPLTVAEERLQDFRYLIPSSPNNVAFIFRAPTLAFIRNVYYMPFYKTSWYCLWGVLFIVTVVLYAIHAVYKKLVPDVEIDLSVCDIIMIQISALFQKSSDSEFKSWSGRIATGFLYMTLMIVTSFYTASIVVYLQANAEDITNFNNLFESRIKMGIENISYEVYKTLKKSRNDVAEDTVRQKIINNYNNKNHTFIMSVEEGIKKVQTEFFAFYTSLETAYDVIANTFEEYEKCSLRNTEGFYGGRELYLMVAKNSTFTDFYRIGKLWEYGIQRREYLKYYRKKPKCENTGMSNFSGTGIVETQVVFLIFIIGAMLSLITFFLEKICNYRNSLEYYEHYNHCMYYCGEPLVQPYVE